MKQVQDNKADAFIKDMFNGVLQDNFSLYAHSFEPEPEDFEDIITRELSFRNCINNALLSISSQTCAVCATAYIDTYQSGFVGAYALALWFLRFDEDNWFGFDQVLEKTRAYINPELPLDKRQELRIFKGLCARGLLTKASSPPDLPVVINHENHTVTIISGELRD